MTRRCGKEGSLLSGNNKTVYTYDRLWILIIFFVLSSLYFLIFLRTKLGGNLQSTSVSLSLPSLYGSSPTKTYDTGDLGRSCFLIRERKSITVHLVLNSDERWLKNCIGFRVSNRKTSRKSWLQTKTKTINCDWDTKPFLYNV